MIKKQDGQELAQGKWLYVRNLPLGTTDESLSAFLIGRGLDVPPSHCSVKSYEHNCTAFISIADEIVVAMLNWVLDGNELDGCVPLIELLKKPSPSIYAGS